MIQKAVNFTLSQDLTGLCAVGDIKLLPKVLDTCEHFTRMTPIELIARATQYKPLFAQSQEF